ncbi:hypothetical protein LTR36_000784 [Oleoguttula mirabilis]|uniref:Uncharacterized protein n=1 Tax=Oleoguttula mirabilis TaxID=1507867 RepID=A0AAV9J378_9PEZI|nr:hypothetical protein LTR36_000784 [Oleoguttula mirabilis]
MAVININTRNPRKGLRKLSFYLPNEIRNQIYEYVMAPGVPTVQTFEALPMYYGLNSFAAARFQIPSHGVTSSLDLFLMWLHAIGPDSVKHLRNVVPYGYDSGITTFKLFARLEDVEFPDVPSALETMN